MRQVPYYLIIGNGRVARHFSHYFSQLKLSYVAWNRTDSIEKLSELLAQATHVLILIRDDAIEDFAATHLMSHSKILIHFSGNLVSDNIIGAHPLTTFNTQQYSLATYQSIPFILDHDAPSFSELLPGLPNSHVRLHKSLKAKYHALCVMSGNFSCLLWQKLFSDFEKELKLPREVAYPYLQQQMHNLIDNPTQALTGPLIRGDTKTIEKNLSALEGDPFKQVYESFIACYQQMKGGQL